MSSCLNGILGDGDLSLTNTRPYLEWQEISFFFVCISKIHEGAANPIFFLLLKFNSY